MLTLSVAGVVCIVFCSVVRLAGSVRVYKYLYGGHMFTLYVAGFVCIVFCPIV